jgi:SnoaL-like protein
MRIALALLLALTVTGATPAPAAPPASDEAVRRAVSDYVGLYRGQTLERWRALFLPGFTAAHVGDDGAVRQRTLEEFYQAQKRYFDTGKSIREDLENVRVERQGALASVWADFVLTEDGEKSRGRLVLLLIEDHGVFRIHSLMFQYR